MTDKELAKRLAELGEAFHEMCMSRNCCEGCEMEAFGPEGVCSYAWVWKLLRAETCGKQDGCPAAQKEEAVMAAPLAEKVKLPKWCKVGQWVMAEWVITGDGKILKIDCITDDLVSVRSPNGLAYCTSTPDLTFKPVRFRPYTYEEAKGLLGKVMEWCYGTNINRCTSIINDIEENEMGVEVNGTKQEDLMTHFSATIDGIPFGIPEIDTEAMKEVE